MSVSSIDTDSTDENHHVHPMEEDQGGDILNTEQEESSFITDSDETEHSGSELAAPARVKEPEPSIAPQTDNKTDNASKTVTQAPEKNSQAKLPTNVSNQCSTIWRVRRD
jgi:BRCT domain type II-containing protein